MKDNYISEEINVKLANYLIIESRDYQWFVDYVDDNFDVLESTTMVEFDNQRATLLPVYDSFIKILAIEDISLSFTNEFIEELWQIARFFNGYISIDEAFNLLRYNFSKLLLVYAWLAKLLNKNTILDARILLFDNYYQVLDLDKVKEEKERIVTYLNEIQIGGIDNLINHFNNNVNNIEIIKNDSFISNHKDDLFSYDCFSYKRINKDDCRTFQEIILLEMLETSVDYHKLTPSMEFNGIKTPDIDSWDKSILENIKNYFDDPIATFIVESVSYILHDQTPSNETVISHCNLLRSEIEKATDYYKIINNSSYKILSYLYLDNKFPSLNNSNEYISFIKTIQAVTDNEFLIKLKESKYPISNKQNRDVESYLNNKIKEIKNIKDVESILTYFEDKDISRSLNDENLEKIDKKFYNLLKNDKRNLSYVAYEKYMHFLYDTYLHSNINKKHIQGVMIKAQESWQNIYCKKTKDSLQSVTTKQQIDNDKINNSAVYFLSDPIILAESCMSYKPILLAKTMEQQAKYPVSFLVSRITINEVYPNKDEIKFKRHDVDNYLVEIVKDILKTIPFEYSGNLDAEKYVLSIHETFRFNTIFHINLFNKSKELYKLVKDNTKIKLLRYSKHITIAHVTQLFPILEMKIREYGKLFSIFPFKIEENEFMKYKDANSILRKMIESVYEVENGLESIPDLMFIYNTMYNDNSFNIRNELIHGKNYYKEEDLPFVFKVTLFCIYMVDFRIKTIKDNSSDMLDVGVLNIA